MNTDEKRTERLTFRKKELKKVLDEVESSRRLPRLGYAVLCDGVRVESHEPGPEPAQ